MRILTDRCGNKFRDTGLGLVPLGAVVAPSVFAAPSLFSAALRTAPTYQFQPTITPLPPPKPDITPLPSVATVVCSFVSTRGNRVDIQKSCSFSPGISPSSAQGQDEANTCCNNAGYRYERLATPQENTIIPVY